MWIVLSEPRQPDHRQHLPRARFALRAFDTAVLEAERHVVANGAPRQQRVLLKDHRGERRSRPIGLDADVARALTEEARQHAQERGFAAPARADDAEELASVGLEGNPVERQDRSPAALEGHADLVHDDFGGACGHRSPSLSTARGLYILPEQDSRFEGGTLMVLHRNARLGLAGRRGLVRRNFSERVRVARMLARTGRGLGAPARRAGTTSDSRFRPGRSVRPGWPGHPRHRPRR